MTSVKLYKLKERTHFVRLQLMPSISAWLQLISIQVVYFKREISEDTLT